MIKLSLSLSFLIVASTSIIYASDRPEDVIASYERSMQRVKESERHEAKPLNTTQVLRLSTRNENIHALVERLTETCPFEVSSIMTQEQLLQKSKKFNTNLYHALNASISQISVYLEHASKDVSLEWTQQHTYCFSKSGIRYPIDGVTLYELKEGKDATDVHVCFNSQLYEIQRQKVCLELTSLWSMLVFWKQSIFHNDTVDSYSAFSAHALQNQIEVQLKKQNDNVNKQNIDRENTNIDHYPLTIIDMLKNIANALPTEIQHNIIVRGQLNSQYLDEKLARNKRAIQEKREIYETSYNKFINICKNLDKCFDILIIDPFVALKSKYFLVNFQIFYKEFVSHRFPSMNGKIKFLFSPLNFQKLMPKIQQERWLPEETAVEQTGSVKDDTTQNLSTQLEGDKGKEEIGTEEEPEVIIYDQAYWDAEHKRHLERKKNLSLNSNNPTSLVSTRTEYEVELDDFLKEYVYKYKKVKSRELINILKELKFVVKPNNSGNGSVHYIMPTIDNPLFGLDINYAGAYFNMHLPHNDGDIIPPDYFSYMKSGFANVFGLKL